MLSRGMEARCNPGDVAIDNDGGLAYARTNTPQGPSFQLSGKNDVLLQMYANANGFAVPLSVSPPYDALADLGSASYSTAAPESGNGPRDGTIGNRGKHVRNGVRVEIDAM